MGVFKRTTNRNGKKREYWYIEYTINGKTKWESVGRVGIVSKSDAKRLFELRQSEILQGRLRTSKDITVSNFSNFAKEYLEFAKGNKKSWMRDEYALRSLIPFFGPYLLTEISPILVEKYKVQRKHEVQIRTVNIELSLLRRMFNLAISWEQTNNNPINKVQFFKEPISNERILSNQEELDLLEHSGPHIKPIIVTALSTGMRISEITNLRWSHVNLESDYITVETSKSGKSRKIPINDRMKTCLNEQKSELFTVKSPGTYDSSIHNTEELQSVSPVRTLACQARGREFKSRRLRHFPIIILQ